MAEEWPRKELPGTAHTRPEAGPAIRREVRGARAGCGEEDAPGAAAGRAASGAGPLRPLPSAGRHCTRRRRPSRHGPTRRRAPQSPNPAASSGPSFRRWSPRASRETGGGNRSYFCNENRGAPGSPLPQGTFGTGLP